MLRHEPQVVREHLVRRHDLGHQRVLPPLVVHLPQLGVRGRVRSDLPSSVEELAAVVPRQEGLDDEALGRRGDSGG